MAQGRWIAGNGRRGVASIGAAWRKRLLGDCAPWPSQTSRFDEALSIRAHPSAPLNIATCIGGDLSVRLVASCSSLSSSSSSSEALASCPSTPLRTTGENIVELSQSTKDKIANVLEELQSEEPIIERYMNSALDPWPDDYRHMQPLVDPGIGDNNLVDAVGRLEDMQVRGPLRDVRYVRRNIDKHWLVITSVDVQGHGFICGLGYSTSVEFSEQLAARQALDRLVIVEQPVDALLAAADQVKGDQNHREANIPAREAGEAIDALKGRLQELAVCSFCPCGKVWMSGIILHLPGQDARIHASAADWDASTSLALCGEILIGRLRWNLKVAPDDPHDPEEWNRTLDERVAAERSSGRWRAGWKKREKQRGAAKAAPPLTEKLNVAALGHYDGFETLMDALVGGKTTRQAHSAALEATVRSWAARHGRSDARATMRKHVEPEIEAPSRHDPEYFSTPKATPASSGLNLARRRFEVTPPATDPRRRRLVSQLPVEKIRGELSRALECAQVAIVSGGTGSGKSTQLPQFLLDDWRSGIKERDEIVVAPRIVVTQPRRLAAVSIAERVAWERSEIVGDSVGFSVRGSSVRPNVPSDRGSVEFVTTGTLLRRAMVDPRLSQCNLVIVDEVHERDIMSDFLLILLREVLLQRNDLRLVLMSATLDVDAFTRYFGGCSILEVPSAQRFPVQEIHLCDAFFDGVSRVDTLRQAEIEGRNSASQLRSDGMYEVDVSKRNELAWWGSDAGDTTFLDVMEGTIYKLVPEVLSTADSFGQRGMGAILCFVPGWADVKKMVDCLREGPCSKSIWAVPLHSSLPKEQQQQVFERGPRGKVKVIVGTNIAESSVTINDVTVVVDGGLQRLLTYDPRRRMSFLDTVWTSRSNAVQRKGRAGRVREGRVVRLYSREQFELMPLRPAPEMQRCDLAQSCLQTLALGRDPHDFLAQALDPPAAAAIELAMAELRAIDAVGPIVDGGPPKIRPVGLLLTRLPLEPLLGRAMMLGVLLDMPELAAALIAVSGASSPFVLHPGKQNELLAKRREFCDWSDTFVSLQTLLSWESICRKDGTKAAEAWAGRHMVSVSRLRSYMRAKYHLLRDVRRSRLLGRSTFDGLGLSESQAANDRSRTKFLDGAKGDEGADDELSSFVETLEESEASVEVGQSVDEWQTSTMDPETDASEEPMLACILCSAYPSNITLREDMQSPNHRTMNVPMARLSAASVNSATNADRGRHQIGSSRSWWVYNELQVSNGRCYLQGTTRVEGWQASIFGGLKQGNSSVVDRNETELVLDDWLTVVAEDVRSKETILALRQELQEALTWQALATLQSGTDPFLESKLVESAADRSRRLCRAFRDCFSGKRPRSDDIELIKGWQPPPQSEVMSQGASGNSGMNHEMETIDRSRHA